MFHQEVIEISEFSFKITIFTDFKSLHNAWAYLRDVICHFTEIIIISTKLQKLITFTRLQCMKVFCPNEHISGRKIVFL